MGDLSLFKDAIMTEGVFMLTEVKPDQVAKIDACIDVYQAEILTKNFIPLAEILSANKVFESGVTHGDSGGHLFCRKRGAVNWTIVGIASKSGYGKSAPMEAQAVAEWHLFSQEDWDDLINGKVRPEKPKVKDFLEGQEAIKEKKP